jgi:hypothetical protein
MATAVVSAAGTIVVAVVNVAEVPLVTVAMASALIAGLAT